MHKWNNPHEWICWYIERLSILSQYSRNPTTSMELAGLARLLASGLSTDELQDMFQETMDETGYFEEIE